MIHLGLVGYPLGHSLSPKLHAAALQAAGLQGDYSLFPVPPDDRQSFTALFRRVRAGEICGLNVTIPHKQNVIEFLDELTPAAESIGAVNTIYLRDQRLIGDNTDAPGFLADLNRLLDHAKSKIVNHKSAIILGGGGSARAVVYALLNDGWQVVLAPRRQEQAQELLSQFSNFADLITNVELELKTLYSLLPVLSLIVNATPVGMYPDMDVSPWPDGVSLPKEVAVYDLIYNPRETLLVRQARSAGLPATTGLGMLVEQAALAFQLWTGHNPSRKIMRDAVR